MIDRWRRKVEILNGRLVLIGGEGVGFVCCSTTCRNGGSAGVALQARKLLSTHVGMDRCRLLVHTFPLT